MGVSDTLSKFAEETSLHGLAYVGQTSSSKRKRLAWMCLFLGALVYAMVQIIYLSECKFTGGPSLFRQTLVHAKNGNEEIQIYFP